MLRRVLVSTLVIGASLYAAPRAQADVIRLLYDRVQLSGEVVWVDPFMSGDAVQSEHVRFDGPSAGRSNQVTATYRRPPGTLGPLGMVAQSYFSPMPGGFDLASLTENGPMCDEGISCPEASLVTASARLDWVFEVEGQNTQVYVGVDAYNSNRDLTGLSLYDVTQQAFLADYKAVETPVTGGEFTLIDGHKYWLSGRTSAGNLSGDPIAYVQMRSNADLQTSPPVPEPTSLLLLGSGAVALRRGARAKARKRVVLAIQRTSLVGEAEHHA